MRLEQSAGVAVAVGVTDPVERAGVAVSAGSGCTHGLVVELAAREGVVAVGSARAFASGRWARSAVPDLACVNTVGVVYAADNAVSRTAVLAAGPGIASGSGDTVRVHRAGLYLAGSEVALRIRDAGAGWIERTGRVAGGKLAERVAIGVQTRLAKAASAVGVCRAIGAWRILTAVPGKARVALRVGYLGSAREGQQRQRQRKE